MDQVGTQILGAFSIFVELHFPIHKSCHYKIFTQIVEFNKEAFAVYRI